MLHPFFVEGSLQVWIIHGGVIYPSLLRRVVALTLTGLNWSSQEKVGTFCVTLTWSALLLPKAYALPHF